MRFSFLSVVAFLAVFVFLQAKSFQLVVSVSTFKIINTTHIGGYTTRAGTLLPFRSKVVILMLDLPVISQIDLLTIPYTSIVLPVKLQIALLAVHLIEGVERLVRKLFLVLFGHHILTKRRKLY